MLARKEISAFSIDSDGCVYNDNYHYSYSKHRLLEENQPLLTHIKNSIQENKSSEAVLLIGSNRQDVEVDAANSTKTLRVADLLSLTTDQREIDFINKNKQGEKITFKSHSCYDALLLINNDLIAKVPETNCSVDTYLLSDTYNNKPSGHNFTNAIIGNVKNCGLWLFDATKLSILYAQIHRLASQNPDANITYNFYDDRSDILKVLSAFFKSNPDLVPKNVKINLHQYDGHDVNRVFSMEGKGEIDFNYEANIKLMAKCAGNDLNPSTFEDGCNIRDGLMKNNGAGLEHFKKNRKLQINRNHDRKNERLGELSKIDAGFNLSPGITPQNKPDPELSESESEQSNHNSSMLSTFGLFAVGVLAVAAIPVCYNYLTNKNGQ